MKKNHIILIILLLFFAHRLQAKLVVVADKGGVYAQAYYDELGLSPLSEKNLSESEPSIITPVTEQNMLPVESLTLSPGIVKPRTIQAQVSKPFFLVGDDNVSKRWLLERKNELIALHAVGLIVNVETLKALNEIRSLIPELTLSPVSGDDIAKRLNLKHYPVLITTNSIVQ